jgi:hypothetical protein
MGKRAGGWIRARSDAKLRCRRKSVARDLWNSCAMPVRTANHFRVTETRLLLASMVSGPGSNNNSVEYRLGPVQGSLEFAANWGSLHKVRAVLFVRQRAARECPVVLIDRCKTDTHLLPCRVRGSGPGMVRARR